MIAAGCGGYGFSLAARFRRKERMLCDMVRVLERMECELQYRLTPLPELCRMASEDASGTLRKIFLAYAGELEQRRMPDAASCMRCVISRFSISFRELRVILAELGQILGRFDLPGQITGLEAVLRKCNLELDALARNRSERLRCYQTLGLCTGAALVILFI